LEKYLTCTEGGFPEVDFSEYTLLLAYGTSTYGVQKIHPELLSTGDEYVLKIEITQNAVAVAESWSIALVTAKMDAKKSIELEVIEQGTVPYMPCGHDGNYLDTTDVKGSAYLFYDSVPVAREAELYQERYTSGYAAWILYDSKVNSATIYILSRKVMSSESYICNYPEFAKRWQVPLNGQKVYYEGTEFKTLEFTSVPPDVFNDMILTTLKKE
jgi:hypothetical protein